MSHSPEFSRRFPLRRLNTAEVEEIVTADPKECEALAARLGLPKIASLTCRFLLMRGRGHGILVEGWLAAKVTQVSVISGEAFEDAVTETFTLRFVPEHAFREDEGIDLDAPDVLPYRDDSIDLGETASEQLALVLDPYPRMPGEGLAEAVDTAPGDGESPAGDDQAEARPNPFAVLAERRGGTH